MCTLFFALRNLRLGRGDRRNATRLALLVTGLYLAIWILLVNHVLTLYELILMLTATSVFLAIGGLFWILYVAIEPFIRRRWPQILVSWTRLLSKE
jgi:hypothetical protein